MNDTRTISLGLNHDVGHLSFEELVGVVDRLRPAGETIGLYRQWLSARPQNFEPMFAAWFNLGVELGKHGDMDGAAHCYRAALLLRPEFQPAAINLGLLLEQGGDTDGALAIWSAALQPDEVRTSLLNQRARLCEQVGRLEDAEHLLTKSLSTDPAQPDAIQHWVHLRQKLCLWPVLSQHVPGLSSDRLLRNAGPLAALALTDDVDLQCRIAADWIERKTMPIAAALAPTSFYRHDRIRIGYLSSDFCRHAMSYLIAELFERHDRERFVIYGYCTTKDDGSTIRARIIDAFDHVRLVRDMDDHDVAQLIRADEVDILIDLNGLTAGARLQILRHRPAPFQATYLGFVGPVPLPELDAMFSDDFVIPVETSSLYYPAPTAIAAHYQANDSLREIGSPLLRSDLDLPDDRFIFACFSNHYKITEEMFSGWMNILERSPGSLLWLSADHAATQQNLRRSAASRYIDPARLLFAERADPSVYMARLAVADLFLDTFPYNAGTIASDALRMGLPLLTRCGQSFASRMASSMLTAIGATEGIANTLDAYVDIAVRFANEPRHFAQYRTHFTFERWRSTIGDIETFTKDYESSLIRMVRSPMEQAPCAA